MLSFDSGKGFMTFEQMFLNGKDVKASFNLGPYKIHDIVQDGNDVTYIQSPVEFYKIDLSYQGVPIPLNKVKFVSIKQKNNYEYDKYSNIITFIVNDSFFIVIVDKGNTMFIDTIKPILLQEEKIGFQNGSNQPMTTTAAVPLSTGTPSTTPGASQEEIYQETYDYNWLLYTIIVFVGVIALILIVSKQQAIQGSVKKFLNRKKKSNSSVSSESSDTSVTSVTSPLSDDS